jgi:hypothetical protein
MRSPVSAPSLVTLPRFVAIMIAIGGFACSAVARADYVTPHAEVVCRKGSDIALVRFGLAENQDRPNYRPLPVRIDNGLSATRNMRRSNCTMGNGWTIRVRNGSKQAFAYGQGGADPQAYFSLWVAQRKIVSRQTWKPGYGSGPEDPWLIAIVVRPTRLTYCYVAAGYEAPEKGAIRCRDEPFRLDRHKVDRIEYASPGIRPPVGTMLVAPGSAEPALCRKYLRARRSDFGNVSLATRDSAGVFGPTPSRESDISAATIEIAPGVRRKLVRWMGDSHYFDGEILFVAPVDADPERVLKPSMLDAPNKFPAAALPPGWHVISGQLPGLYPDVSWRYVHFDTQRIDGRLYLLAQPTNLEERPTAIVVRPSAQGFKRVCVFQRVEPNF